MYFTIYYPDCDQMQELKDKGDLKQGSLLEKKTNGKRKSIHERLKINKEIIVVYLLWQSFMKS